ncbi:MAG TPA: ABC transporter substrate-binding protein [Moorella mulderi]|nr:ABC transporter substrate-binding protein [Moorella mulderi]
MRKSIIGVGLGVLILLSAIFFMGGCGAKKEAAPGQTSTQVPVLKVGYIRVTCHTPLKVVTEKGEELKSWGVYLKPVVPGEKYDLMEGDKKLAQLELVVTKSGAESTTLFAQKHLDLALGAMTAMMMGIDQGVPIKIISPLNVGGMGLVFPKGSPVKDWDGFLKLAREAKEPVKVGYHSPTSSPKIAFESVFHQQGLKMTNDPSDTKANILWVDLKDTQSLLPALSSRQVDAFVGPQPYPQLAEAQGVGQVVAELRDLPPKGQWKDFPCCVIAAREEVIREHPQALKAFLVLMDKSFKWCQEHPNEAAQIAAQWLGMPVEVAQKAEGSMAYLSQPTDNWMQCTGTYLEMLNKMNKFSGSLKGKTLEEVKGLLFDFSLLPKK